MKKHLLLPGLIIFSAVLLAACSTQSPFVVIVTPTHQSLTSTSPTLAPGISSLQTSLPTLSSTPLPITPTPLLTQILTQTVSPTVPTANITFGAVSGTLIPAATSTPSGTALPTSNGSETATATFGAVIGPNYTPPTLITASPTIPGTLIIPTAVATTPGPSPTPLPVLNSKLMGIQIHGALTDTDWQTMLDYSKRLGVGWIKIQLQWKELEPGKGVYDQSYSGLTLKIQRAHIQGFKTLISIDTAPDWARGPGPHQEDGPPTNPQDLADFMTHLVQDIKPSFLDAIEVWNEPNLRREWNGSPLSASAYMKVFDAAYRAIRLQEQAMAAVSDPGHRIVIIVAGPASGTPDGDSSINDRNWVKQLYAAGLAHYGADVALGVHPYGWANAPDATCCTAGPGVTGWYTDRGFYFKDTLDDYRQIMVANGDSAAQLWVTEFGWATYDGLHRSDGSAAGAPTDASFGWLKLLNQQQQADYVLRAFSMAQHPPYAAYVGPLMLWNLNFGTIPDMIDNGRQEAGFSLLDFNGSARPVYQAIAAAPKQ